MRRSAYAVVSDLAERLEDGKGHISALAECLRIINQTKDQRRRLEEVDHASHHLRAIFNQYHLQYQEVQALREALRQVNVTVEY